MAIRNSDETTLNLITTGQAAASFEPPCSTENVRRLVRLGRLRPAALVGRGQMLFDRTEILRLVAERRTNRG